MNIKNSLLIIISLIIVTTSFADDVNNRGYVTLLTLSNLNSLKHSDSKIFFNLKKYEKLNANSSKNAARNIASNLMYASNMLHDSIINKNVHEKFESLKSISADIEYFWIDFYDDRLMSKYMSCYKAGRNFEDIWNSINMFDTETAYPSIHKNIDHFNLNLSICIKSSADTMQ